MKMKKLGIVITDGVGFRNFILSDFINEAENKFAHLVIYSCIPIIAYKEFNFQCKIIELPEFKENFITWFFRKAKEVAHLQKFSSTNFGINDNLKINESKALNIRGYTTRFIFVITRFFHSERNILFFARLQELTYSRYKITKQFREILKKDEVDLLFFTHQRPPFIAPLIYQAEKLKIKTAAFIFSWDNLASKGRMTGSFDYYLVWSHLMKKELLHFYASVKDSQIEIVGTPQFEPYVLERYQTTKANFYKKFNLDLDLKTICFSCGDTSTSKNDELYIELISSFMMNNQFIENVNFIVRTSPAEDGARFDALKNKFIFIKWNIPKWKLARDKHQEIWTQRIPTKEDVIDLRGILEHSDVFINMLSTMSLDAMNFNKPVINPAFGNAQNGLFNDQRFLKYKHIEYVVKTKSTAIVKEETELLVAINEALENPESRLKQQEELIQLEIGEPLEGTSKRIANTLLRWS
jgi:hypothetical protein